MFIIFKWGWGDSSITYKIKLRVTKAVCCQVVYDCGIKYTFSFSQLPVWKKLNSAIEWDSFLASTNPLSTSHSGSQKYVDYIEHMHLNYIRKLFRSAQNIKGGKELYEELIITMNQKSSIPSKTRCILLLRRI